MGFRRLIRLCVLLGVCIGLGPWLGAPSYGAGPADSAEAFSFVVFGDNQFSTKSPTSGVPERMAVPEVVRGLKPTFILHTGDLMDHGWQKDAYDKFVEYYQGMLDEIPFFPTVGNHDCGRGGIVNYAAFLKQQLFERNAKVYGADAYKRDFRIRHEDDPTDYPRSFQDPKVSEFKDRVPSGVCFKTCYALRFRNAVVISLEQGTRWWTNTPLPWLEKHLREAREDKGVDHIFVIMHHPMYSSTMREEPRDPLQPAKGECIAPVRKVYEDLFRRYDVTAVFSGHAHLYDRFYVPDDDKPTHGEEPLNRFSHDGKGIHYVVTGGGGGPLVKGRWRQERSDAYRQNRVRAYHVTEVCVEGRRLTVNVHLVSGTGESPEKRLFESLTIAPGD